MIYNVQIINSPLLILEIIDKLMLELLHEQMSWDELGYPLYGPFRHEAQIVTFDTFLIFKCLVVKFLYKDIIQIGAF